MQKLQALEAGELELKRQKKYNPSTLAIQVRTPLLSDDSFGLIYHRRLPCCRKRPPTQRKGRRQQPPVTLKESEYLLADNLESNALLVRRLGRKTRRNRAVMNDKLEELAIDYKGRRKHL